MKKKKKILDTNIVLRFLVKDDLEQYNKVIKLFSNAEIGSLEIPDSVVCETVFVLSSVYELSKGQITEFVEDLILFNKFKVNQTILINTLSFYNNYNIAFLDAYLCAKAKVKDQELISFDKRILKIKEVKSMQP